MFFGLKIFSRQISHKLNLYKATADHSCKSVWDALQKVKRTANSLQADADAGFVAGEAAGFPSQKRSKLYIIHHTPSLFADGSFCLEQL